MKEKTEWFGYRKVSATEKNSLVREVFDSVSDKYDLMNDFMSFGVHRIWKDIFVNEIRPAENLDYLDVAGGTGDIAGRIRKKTSKNARITVCDINHNMLVHGRNKLTDQGLIDFEWITGNAEELPFPDNSFDIYTISFGLRNVTHIDKALNEAFRVLKPGGRFFCLEFSKTENKVISKLYDAYSFGAIPKIGKIVADDSDSYRYLVESIRNFPNQKELVQRIKSAGFSRCWYNNLSGGIVAIHRGFKDHSKVITCDT